MRLRLAKRCRYAYHLAQVSLMVTVSYNGCIQIGFRIYINKYTYFILFEDVHSFGNGSINLGLHFNQFFKVDDIEWFRDAYCANISI